ncbi:MAG: phosphoribosylformylglycinamidine cyclo-ligase [Parcubacteria group bacterium Gr01-1014_30]|nr:MAG: phosphoribosylformylglycinamidine cyclo-ligase [Parcubacteria group bacterium Gr01-1014_30]
MKTYARAGVSRNLRKEAKKSLKVISATFGTSKSRIIKTPFNFLYPVGKNVYHVKTSDGVGTKVLLAQAARKHDTIGIDAVAMVVNDCIRCGARPIAFTDIIDLKKSDPKLFSELQKGLILGAERAGCPLVGGETADVPELLKVPYHINCDCVGEVKKKDIITGEKIKAGNVVIGLRSSGLHSNGFTLARKVLFKKWGGKFDFSAKPKGFDRSLFKTCLEPTKIYVRQFLKAAKKFRILGAVHITGDAYLKFQNLMKDSLGFEFDNFKPQPIFDLIQKTGKVSNKEMFKTFNMGWGFALILRERDTIPALAILKKERQSAEIIGRVTLENKIVIKYKDKIITL